MTKKADKKKVTKKKASKKKAAQKKVSKKKAVKKKAVKKKTRQVAKKTARKQAPPRAPTKTIDPAWYTQMQVAELLGVSERTVQRWDIPAAARQGIYTYYHIRDVLVAAVERAEKRGHEQGFRAGRDAVPEDLGALLLEKEMAETLRTKEQAENYRLKNEQLRRSLAPVEMLSWALGDLAAQISAVLEPLPGNLKRAAPKLTNAEVHIIQREIVKAQNLAAQARLDWDEYSDNSSSD